MPQNHVWFGLVRRVMTIGAIGFLPLSLAAQTRQPDNHIKNSYESEYIGNDIYNINGENQTVAQISPVGHAAIFHVKIENDWGKTDSFRVRGSASNSVCSRKYFDALEGGNDITEQLSDVVNGWSTGPLAPGNCREIRLEMTMLVPVYNHYTTLVRSDSYDDAGSDAVKCSLIVNTNQPDNAIHGPGNIGYKGNDVYNETGRGQTATFYSRAGNTVNYHVLIGNDGLEDEPFIVTGTPGGKLWTVRYFDSDDTCNINDEITDQVTSEEGWLTPQLPATAFPSEGVLIEVTSSAGAEPKDSYTVTLTSTSTIDPEAKDVVVAITTIDFIQPDLHIRANDVYSIGDDIYNEDGKDQTLTQLISEGGTVTYHLRLENDGFHRDSFIVKGSSAPPGWNVRYLRYSYRQERYLDTTSAVTGPGLLTRSLDNSDSEYELPVLLKIEVERVSPEASDSIFTVNLKATSIRAPEFCDVVKAITIVPAEDISETDIDISSFLAVTPGSAGYVLIEYGLTQTTEVSLAIYDVTGRQARILEQGVVDSGRHTVSWDGCDGLGRSLPRGVYFCRLETKGFIASRKVVLSR